MKTDSGLHSRELTLSSDSLLEDLIGTARDWADNTKGHLQQAVSVDSGEGRNSIENFAWHTRGTRANISISFQFLRYLIMIEKGAGRGYAGKKGSNWYDRKGEYKKTNPDSIGKMGTGARKAAAWFNPVLKLEIVKLADAAAENYVIEVKKLLIK